MLFNINREKGDKKPNPHNVILNSSGDFQKAVYLRGISLQITSQKRILTLYLTNIFLCSWCFRGVFPSPLRLLWLGWEPFLVPKKPIEILYRMQYWAPQIKRT